MTIYAMTSMRKSSRTMHQIKPRHLALSCIIGMLMTWLRLNGSNIANLHTLRQRNTHANLFQTVRSQSCLPFVILRQEPFSLFKLVFKLTHTSAPTFFVPNDMEYEARAEY
eukprot:scaffold6280_cov127-Skeletonema_marinoi.AAC.6